MAISCDFQKLPRRGNNHSFVSSNISIRVRIIGTHIINLTFSSLEDLPPWISCPQSVSSSSVWSSVVSERDAEHAMVLALSIKVGIILNL